MLKIFRQFFRISRWIFRLSGIGKIKIGNTLLYVPIRTKLYRFIWRIADLNPEKPIEIAGHKILGIGPNRGGLNGLSLLMNTYEEDSSFMFREFIDPGSNVIDIGAHIGFYSLIAAEKVGPSGRVFAFEPEIENYKWLKKNVDLNGYQNVKIVTKAVTEKSGSINLWIGNSSGSHSIYQNFSETKGNNSNQNTQIVDTVSIDDFLESQGWPNIQVIKMDVEGAEKLAFEGMQELFKRQEHLKIIFEYNRLTFEENGIDSMAFFKILLDNNFTLFHVSKKNKNALSIDEISNIASELMTNINLVAIKE